MRYFFARQTRPLLSMNLTALLLFITSVSGTGAPETNDITYTTPSARSGKVADFDVAKLQVGARIVYISSGTKAVSFRTIDGERRTKFRFSSADLHPTVIVELAQNQPVHRVSVVSEIGQGHVDIYLLTALATDPGDLRNAKPLASIVGLAQGGEAAVDFEPSNARYVALRWSREKPSNHPLDVTEISAFAFITREDLPRHFPMGICMYPARVAPI